MSPSIFRRAYVGSFSLIAIALVLMTLGGCSGVTTREIIGEPSAKTAKAMEGTWQVGEAVFQIKDVGDGKISMATTEWKDNKWQLTTFTCVVSTFNGQEFIHLPASVLTKDEPDKHRIKGNPEEYFFARLFYYTHEPRTVVAHLASVKAFRQAVEDKMLKGTIISDENAKIDKTKVRLQASAKEIEAFLTSEDFPGSKFSAEDPLVYVRIK